MKETPENNERIVKMTFASVEEIIMMFL